MHMGDFGRVGETLVAGCTAGAVVVCFHCTALVWQTAASLSSATLYRQPATLAQGGLS